MELLLYILLCLSYLTTLLLDSDGGGCVGAELHGPEQRSKGGREENK